MPAKESAKGAPKAAKSAPSKASAPAASKPFGSSRPAPANTYKGAAPAKAASKASAAAAGTAPEAPASKAPEFQLSPDSLCQIEILKDGHFFIARTHTLGGGQKEYKNTVFEDMLTEMVISLQEQIAD